MVKKLKKEKLYTSNDLAELFGVPPRAVLYAIRHGYIKAEKLGWVWIIREDDVPETWPIRK